ncbi:hypothetical protein CcaverHIS002_0509520 [Cutaneotrichosporon cavernicola]|uniref:CID domain-containing protein n=1 Tax=Cutaneotrichosporon cavernicola TaxID=279322 RepID=A0AA48L7K4_9TREE|nr:uncharacterized protein CcaverHIS019_0510080 [Cutaneotrichosporon cavernicola]BEI85551.1 hypothetical protein CcaverHIS002_0509520 [Cutaneotrichosporon cavernicola]BEI93380.1 hypothetical protein CcaverHIS019_0510080 [Cutaneotrichosporon cavernicola]BEJ01158.1 hypothetical protein CcaverHIS631_0510150 [Cutaneotrichosporon cavernicola]BEJ08926.1 hypothetical protein CcaverHIS641_0510200 [Cutaneotrichosporon cavernicola]
MSLDPFEARLQFLKFVRTLNASQQSIQKVVSFAVKYGAKCGDDLWECVADEIGKGSLNARINILYLLDSLAETSAAVGPPDAPYLPLIERGLPALVAAVVPATREGHLNARSARQILESWRARRVLDPAAVDAALKILAGRRRVGGGAGEVGDGRDGEKGREGDKSGVKVEGRDDKSAKMSRTDILRRIEEDRERQKRLRERMWILPVPPLTTASAAPSPFLTPASPKPGVKRKREEREMLPPRVPGVQPLDVEFEQMWEGTSDLDDDDYERMRENAVAAGLL